MLHGMRREGYSAAMEVYKKIEDFAWMGFDDLEVTALFMAAKNLPLFIDLLHVWMMRK